MDTPEAVLRLPYRAHVALGLGAAAAGVLIWLNPALAMHGAALFRGTCSLAPEMFTAVHWLPSMPWLLFVLVGVTTGAAAGAVVLRQIRASQRTARHVWLRARSAPQGLDLEAKRLGVHGRLVYVDDAAPYAFCWGFFRPAICVSSGLVRRLDDEELRAVLLHERHHLERLDPLRLLLLRLGAVFVPLPVIGELWQRLRLSRELQADAFALESVARGALAGALLKTAPSRASVSRWAGACAFGLNEARAHHLLGRDVDRRLSSGGIAATVAVLAGFFTAGFGITAGTAFLTTSAIHCSNFLLTLGG